MATKKASKEAAADLAATTISPDVAATLANTIPGLVAQVTRRFNIDQVRAETGSVGDLDVSRIELGDATIGNIVLTNANASLNGAQAFMQNVRVVLELRFRLEWEVDLGWLGSWDGTENLGSLSFGMNVGNVSVPSLADIDMHIPSMTVANASARMQPITNVDLGGATFRSMQARNTNAPADGLSLQGMGVGAMRIENVRVPKTTTEGVTLQEFSPNASVVLPGAQVRDLRIPSANVDDITTGGFDLSAVASRRCLEADLGILELKICVDPIMHMDVGSMLIEDADLTASAQQLDVENIQLPVTVKGISMSDLMLNSVTVNRITL